MCYSNTQRGASLFFAFLTITLILGIVFGINTLFLDQLKSVRNIGTSVGSLAAADAGIERVFYDDRNGVDVTDNYCPYPQPRVPPGPYAHCTETINLGSGIFLRFTLEITLPSDPLPIVCPAARYCAKSTGTVLGIDRALKILR